MTWSSPPNELSNARKIPHVALDNAPHLYNPKAHCLWILPKLPVFMTFV